MSVDLGEFKPARCMDHGSDACDCSGLRAELAAARDEIERLRQYGDGPERGNRQTWAFMAAECARLMRERDEARREVKRLRPVADAAEQLIPPVGPDSEPWYLVWDDDCLPGSWYCGYCVSDFVAKMADVRHADNCPAIALDRALDAIRAEPTDA